VSRAKPTREEADRRRDYVVEWSKKGCSRDQIAAALGVSVGVVQADRARRSRQLAGVQMHSGGMAKLPPAPPPFDWMAPPPPEVKRAYRISMMPRVQNLLSYLQESNARARLPYNIEEAREVGDEQWHLQSQLLLSDTIAYLQDLMRILQDKSARQEAATSIAARDDLTVPRAVISGEVSLPAQGTGELPGRLFRLLMGYHWAGIELTDEDIAQIGRRETATPERVRRAIREYKAALASNQG
jgi:hypothetical protein